MEAKGRQISIVPIHNSNVQTEEIIALLKKEHNQFLAYVEGLADDDFVFAAPGKWTAGQQLKHIYLAVRPVALALGFPKVLLRILFGKSKRGGRTYDELVMRYRGILESGGKASSPFIPGGMSPEKKNLISRNLRHKVDLLCNRLHRFSDEDLDILLLPHPLLGKCTIREMLYFTIYHVGHHHAAVRRGLSRVRSPV